MGVITLALVAHGNISATAFHVPTWVVIASASAISIGTFTGGWRIIRTLGTRIVNMDAAQGSPHKAPAQRSSWPPQASATRSPPPTSSPAE